MPKGVYVRSSGVGGPVSVAIKTCGICKVAKPLTEFHADRKGSDGRRWCCNPCRKISAQRYYQRTRRNPQFLSRIRATHLRRKFGMSPQDYAALYEKQGGACAICRHSSLAERLSIDHDHKSGTVRGLLCRNCNFAIGLMRDNPALMAEAISYLQRSTL